MIRLSIWFGGLQFSGEAREGHERAAEMIEDCCRPIETFGMPTYAAEAERLCARQA